MKKHTKQRYTHTYHLVLVAAEAVLRFSSSHSLIPIVVPLPHIMLKMLRYVHKAF